MVRAQNVRAQVWMSNVEGQCESGGSSILVPGEARAFRAGIVPRVGAGVTLRWMDRGHSQRPGAISASINSFILDLSADCGVLLERWVRIGVWNGVVYFN